MALAAVLLAIFLVRAAIIASRTLKAVEAAVHELRGKATEAMEETVRAVRETRMLAEELHDRSRQAEQLFQSVQELGKSLHEVSSGIAREAERHKDRLGQVVALLAAGIELAKLWRKED
jgi:uncharacterized protein YoxC